MKKLFENKTSYDSDTYTEFLHFHSDKFSFSYLVYTIVWCALFILCIYLAFSEGNRLQGVIVTIILLCFIIYRFYRPKKIAEKELKSEKVSTNNTNTFSFYEKNFSIENNNGTFNYRYFTIKKIYETSDFFYLYVTDENAFLISKSGFTIGTQEDFSAFLKKKCKFKFKK